MPIITGFNPNTTQSSRIIIGSPFINPFTLQSQTPRYIPTKYVVEIIEEEDIENKEKE